MLLTIDLATAELVGRTVRDIELHARFTVTEVVPEPGATIVVMRVIEPGDHYDMDAEIEIPVGPAHVVANRFLRIDS